MRKIGWFTIALMLLATTALAHPCKQARDSRGRYVSASPSLQQNIESGFRLTAGIRWDQEYAVSRRKLVKDGHDSQPYVGASLTLPLIPRWEYFGSYDRDLVDGPDWSAKVGISYRPFGK